MEDNPGEAGHSEEITLNVDDRGRLTLPEHIQNELGIEPNDKIHARLIGSVLEINLNPGSELQTATAKRNSWEDTTPADAGESLFGPMNDRKGTDK